MNKILNAYTRTGEKISKRTDKSKECKKLRRECWSNVADKTIDAVGIVLYVVMIVLCFAVLIIIVQAVFPEGVKNMVDFWVPYKAVLIALFSVVTLFVAHRQLIKYLAEFKRQGDIEEVKAIIEIRKLLDTIPGNFKIHTKLVAGNCEFPKDPEKVTLYCRYLGTIELASIMVQKGIISFEQFRKQFGYRVENIMACKSLMSYLKGVEREYWEDLWWIIDNFNQSKK